MKKLIVNPADPSSVKMLDLKGLMEAVVSKTLKMDRANFKPVVVNDAHLRLFLANVSYRVVAVSNYTGAELGSMDEAFAFFDDFSRYAYRNLDTNARNDFWMTHLLKSEIDADRSENTVYGVETDSADMMSRIPIELNLIANVEVNPLSEQNKAASKKSKHLKN